LESISPQKKKQVTPKINSPFPTAEPPRNNCVIKAITLVQRRQDALDAYNRMNNEYTLLSHEKPLDCAAKFPQPAFRPPTSFLSNSRIPFTENLDLSDSKLNPLKKTPARKGWIANYDTRNKESPLDPGQKNLPAVVPLFN
jgi:hypothetical protein